MVAFEPPDLFDADAGRFFGVEEDVVVGGVSGFGEHAGDEVSAEVVAAAGGDMDGAEGFLVLNVGAAEGKDLGAEAEFADFAGDGVGGEFLLVSLDGAGVAFDELDVGDAAVFDGLQGDGVGILLVLHGEDALGAFGDEVDFAGGEVGDVGVASVAEAVAFLGLLAVEDQGEGVGVAFEFEIDFDFIGFGEAGAEFFGLGADVVVVDGEAAADDDVVEAVHGGAAEAVFFGMGGEGGGGGVVADAENEVVGGVDVVGEVDLFAVGADGGVGEVEVASTGGAVGEEFASVEVEFLHHTFVQAVVEDLVGFALHGAGLVLEEGEVASPAGVRKVDEHADAASVDGVEHGFQQAGEVEGGVGAFASEGVVGGGGEMGHKSGRFLVFCFWFLVGLKFAPGYR